MMQLRRLVLLLAVVVFSGALLGTVVPAAPRSPAPHLLGRPLPRYTSLRLLVADRPPLALDVDTGRIGTVRGVPTIQRGTVSIIGVGGRAAVVIVASSWRHARLYAVRGQNAKAQPLGVGREAVAGADGRSVWVKSFDALARCTLRHVRLDGRVLRRPRPFPCRSTIDAGGALGVLVSRTRVIDPATGHILVRSRLGVLAVAGKTLVLADGPTKRLALLRPSGAPRALRWPSIVDGLEEPAVDPSGRYVVLQFGDPTWTGSAGQAFDVWVLDTREAKLTELPGLPAFVALKATSLAWTADGRLVLLAQERGGLDIVAVWRPGQRQLALKPVRLPDRSDSGSDSFAVIR